MSVVHGEELKLVIMIPVAQASVEDSFGADSSSDYFDLGILNDENKLN